MNRAWWILVAVLALGAGIVVLALLDEPAALAGRPHPEIPAMRQGGDGLARHGALLVPGWLFGCGIILCLSTVVHFGALRGRGREPLALLLKVVTVLYLSSWSWLVWAYRASLDDLAPDLILTLPRPTAIMIFVFWPISLLFSALFVAGFNRWVVTPDEDAAFRRLVEQHRRSEEP